MSSPFEPGTKGKTEESIQAIERTLQWASRIDTNNDLTSVDVEGFTTELRTELETLRRDYRIKTTERSIDNFVFNHEETVSEIMCGNLDAKVSAVRELESYISDEFGYEDPLDLSKENLLWLVAQQVKKHVTSSRGMYSGEPYESMDLDSEGERPEHWQDEEYPIHRV